jgi:putative endonuclease
MYSVYILLCEDTSLYTGIATDVRRRFAEHLAGTGAKYTRSHPPKKIVYQQKFKTRNQALKREAEIKNLTRKEKLALLEQ